MSSAFGLPAALMPYLADSKVEVVSWDGEKDSLILRVSKEIGPEVGLLTFWGVSHVNLPQSVTVERIESGGIELLPPGWLDAFRPGDKSLDPDERVFAIQGSWGSLHYVIAQTAAYQINS